MNEKILELIKDLKIEILKEIDFREKQVPKPHPTDAIRSIEREWTKRGFVEKLEDIIG